jgi:hypothetical protein
MNDTKVSDLTVDELVALMRQEMSLLLREAVQDALAAAQTLPNQMAIFDIPTLTVDPRHPALHLTSREGIYDDDDS